MTEFASWFSPSVMQSLGWTLLHFLWQGAALAALLSAMMAVCRGANARYALAVATLVLMVAAPALTFVLIRQTSPAAAWVARRSETAATGGAAGSGSLAGIEGSGKAMGFMRVSTPMMSNPAVPPDPLLWLVEGWFAGVVLFSLRAAGGLLLLERLRRRDASPVNAKLRERCLELQRHLGLDRAIRYCQCRLLEAPAVIGWFRPVVLLPATALTGLSPEQLEAVIAHELAHIRRFDGLVNLFQIAAETMLFYHPAVWWVSRRIRIERENCCDDAAVSACGDAAEYARTLMLMEEWRSAPSLAMAVNRSPLAARVARLLGMRSFSGRAPGAGLAAALLCLGGALLAGNALVGVAHPSFHVDIHLDAAPRQISQTVEPAGRPGVSAGPTWPIAKLTALISQTSAPRAADEKAKKASPASTKEEKESSGKESFIEGLKAAGLENLTVDQLLAMKIQGVTAEYVRQVHDLGLRPVADELIAMRTQGVTPEYIRAVRSVGLNPTVDQLIAMKTQGVTPEYIRELHELGLPTSNTDELVGMRVQGVTPEYVRDMGAAGLHPTTEQLIAMKVQGVTPEYVRGLHELGLRTEADELVGMRVQGVTPEYVRDMGAAGLHPTTEQLIAMKVQGVTPEYVRGLHERGLPTTNTDELVGMRVQGVTPEYVRDMRAAGLNPTAEQLVAMRVQGVTPDYVRALQAAGLRRLQVDDYLAAKVQGITPEFVEKARKHGFQDLDLDKLIALKQAGVL